MPEIDFGDVKVLFPHDPYSVQVSYMEAVVRALKGGSNALLESPTGTGKTLSLLCATLAWVTSQNSDTTAAAAPSGAALPPVARRRTKVFYLSRTHAQLKQVVKEFRRTEYGKIATANTQGRRSGVIGDNAGMDRVGSVLRAAPPRCGGVSDASLPLSMVVLGSREQLCVHPRLQASSASAKNAMCASLRRENGCRFYTAVQPYLERTSGGRAFFEEERPRGSQNSHSVGDIEDLHEMGKKHGICPFYFSRRVSDAAEVVFAPYNYLIDRSLRAQLGVDLEGAVILIDEAHNLSANAIAASSMGVTNITLGEAMAELGRAADRVAALPEETMKKAERDVKARNIRVFITMVDKLRVRVEKMHAAVLRRETEARDAKEKHAADAAAQIMPGVRVLQILREEMNLHDGNFKVFREGVEEAVTYISGEALQGSAKSDVYGIDNLLRFLSGVFTAQAASFDLLQRCYRTVVFEDRGRDLDKKHHKYNIGFPINLGLLCADAGVVMSQLTQPPLQQQPRDERAKTSGGRPRCCLITSGTMKPMNFFAEELGIPFPVMLESDHVIEPKQVLGYIAKAGPNNVELNSRFANRTNEHYVQSLGMSVARVCQTVRGGVLVFFQSFSFKTDMLAAWRKPMSYDSTQSIMDAITRRKFVCEEPSQSKQQAVKLVEYKRLVMSGTAGEGGAGITGAVMFGVYRGKMAEGTDFPDDLCRAVCLVGLPYANRSDLNVQIQMEKNNSWYTTDAMRAVNQAVGRIVRHKRDFGCVFLLDARFADPKVQKLLPSWVGRSTRVLPALGDEPLREAGAALLRLRSEFEGSGRAAQHNPLALGAGTDAGSLYDDSERSTDLLGGQRGTEPNVQRRRASEAFEAYKQDQAFKAAREYQELRDAQDPAMKAARATHREGLRRRLDQPSPGAAAAAFRAADFQAGAAEASPGASAAVGGGSSVGRRVGASVGSVAVKQYTLAEYVREVQRILSKEDYVTWRGFARQLAQLSQETNGDFEAVKSFLDAEYVPFLVRAYTLQHQGLLRSYACTMPAAMRPTFLNLVRQHLKLAGKQGRRPS